jgi:hypothetical protein
VDRVIPVTPGSLAKIRNRDHRQRDVPGDNGTDDPEWFVKDLQSCMIPRQNTARSVPGASCSPSTVCAPATDFPAETQRQ